MTGIFFSGNNNHIYINNGYTFYINSVSSNSNFSIIGTKKDGNLFENKGNININTGHIMFIGNEIYGKDSNDEFLLIKNYSSSILGSENTRSINIIKNTFKAPSSLSSSKTYRAAIFYEDEESTNNFTINSKVLNIDSNIIEDTVRQFFLFDNGNKSKKELQIGTNTTEVINITNNKFHAKENYIIRINTENAVLNITTKN